LIAAQHDPPRRVKPSDDNGAQVPEIPCAKNKFGTKVINIKIVIFKIFIKVDSWYIAIQKYTIQRLQNKKSKDREGNFNLKLPS